MNLEQQVASLELCKKLKSLGVKQESLYYWQKCSMCNDDWELSQVKASDYEQCSAFTVAELGEMLPMWHDSCKRDTNDWHVRVFEKDKDNMVHNSFDTNEANARAKMLIYLIENKLMEV